MKYKLSYIVTLENAKLIGILFLNTATEEEAKAVFKKIWKGNKYHKGLDITKIERIY